MRWLFALIFLYCLVRVPIILSHFDPSVDELDRGTIAKEFLEGRRLPILDYQTDPYGGGSLFAAAYTVPFFALFGKNVFALKLVPFCWHLLSLVAWFFVFRAHFPPLQTFFILLFFVLSPPRITEYGLHNNGYHFEMILWMAISILIFRRFLKGGLSETRAGIFLGLLGGFSSWMILTNLVTTLVIWFYLALVQGTSVRKFRFYGFYAIAFLVSFSPWILYQFIYGWERIIPLIDFFRPKFSAPYYLHNFYWAFRRGLRVLLGFRHFTPVFKYIFMETYTFLYVISFAVVFWNKRKSIFWLEGGLDIIVFGLFFQILLYGIFVASNLHAREYYLYPMVPFMGMTLVIFGNSLKPALRGGMILFCLLAGILGNMKLVRWDQMGSTRLLPGYSYTVWSLMLESRMADNFSLFKEKFKKLVEGRPMVEQKFFYQAIPPDYYEKLEILRQ